MEAKRDVGVGVSFLFKGQFNIQPNRFTLTLGRAAIGGGHDARPAASDNGQVVPRQFLADGCGRAIVRVLRLRARRAEDGHGRADLRENLERIDKFRHDAKDAPRVFFGKGDSMVNHVKAHLEPSVGALQAFAMVREIANSIIQPIVAAIDNNYSLSIPPATALRWKTVTLGGPVS